MRRALVLAITIAMAASAPAAGEGFNDSTPLTCDGRPADFHVDAGKRIIRTGYSSSRAPDPSPMRASEKRALRAHKFCLADKGRRARLEAFRERVADAYRRELVPEWPAPESLGVSTATLDAIASCESGGDPDAHDPSGTYHGMFQFDSATWASVGGAGEACEASVDEQYFRAARLYARAGSAPWPVCG